MYNLPPTTLMYSPPRDKCRIAPSVSLRLANAEGENKDNVSIAVGCFEGDVAGAGAGADADVAAAADGRDVYDDHGASTAKRDHAAAVVGPSGPKHPVDTPTDLRKSQSPACYRTAAPASSWTDRTS